MVGSTPSVAQDAAGLASRISKGAAAAASASAIVPFPRKNGWTSRAVRNSARALAHPGLMPAHHLVGDSNNNSPDSLSSGRTASANSSSAAPAGAHPTAATTSSSVPVLAITFGAVGGLIALAVVLALVYVRRIRRRVKSMKRRTNVLGPELAPQLSSPIDSPSVKFEGMRISSPRMTSEMSNHMPVPPLSAVSVSSTTCTELPSITPLSPIRTSTFILSPPPAAKRSTIRSSNPIPIPIPIPIPHSNPRSSNHSPRALVPWPLITALSLRDCPQHVYEERNTSMTGLRF